MHTTLYGFARLKHIYSCSRSKIQLTSSLRGGPGTYRAHIYLKLFIVYRHALSDLFALSVGNWLCHCDCKVSSKGSSDLASVCPSEDKVCGEEHDQNLQYTQADSCVARDLQLALHYVHPKREKNISV